MTAGRVPEIETIDRGGRQPVGMSNANKPLSVDRQQDAAMSLWHYQRQSSVTYVCTP